MEGGGAAVGDGAVGAVDDGQDGRCRFRAVDRAGVQAEGFQGLGGAVGDAGSGAEGAAQLAHDAGSGEAAADDIADGHRDAVARQVDEVVPVPAHVQPPTAGR